MQLKTFFLILYIFFNAVLLNGQGTVLNGPVKYYYENGKLSSEGLMKEGKPDGYWTNYYKNGKVKIEGNRKNFLLEGTWKFYDEKGRLSKSINYSEGKKDGPTKIYDTLENILVVEEKLK